MTGTPARAHRASRRPTAVVLVALAATVLAMVVGAAGPVDAHASNLTGKVAGTHVRASDLVQQAVVGAGQDVLPGQSRETSPSGSGAAIGSRVAPRSATSTADDLVGAACSFSAATAVVMADGTSRAISEIKVGDSVLAEDPGTGERGPRKVTHVWEHEDTVVDLEIDGDLVTTTEDHPFWNATDGEWQEARDLDTGDLVRTAGGQPVAVGGLKLRSARITTAFNLTVDDIHTYYVAVGEDQVLVHNTCDVGHAGDHQFPGTRPGKSQFFDGEDLRNLSDTTGRSGYVQPNGNTRYVMHGASDVGVDATTSLPTDIYTVIRRPDGSVVTMYPGTSPKG